MNTLEKAAVIHYHRELLEQHPASPARMQGWKDTEGQQKRFEALCGMADLTGASVLDVGCGMGDLRTYLDTRFRRVTYCGIDILPEFIQAARKTYAGRSDTYFVQADFMVDGFPQVDYVLASGAFNYPCDNLLFPYMIIRKMLDAANKGVAFNLLDDEFHAGHTDLKTYDQVEILKFCMQLAPHTEVVNGYYPGDFTMLLLK